jgi:hypothetical protein
MWRLPIVADHPRRGPGRSSSPATGAAYDQARCAVVRVVAQDARGDQEQGDMPGQPRWFFAFAAQHHVNYVLDPAPAEEAPVAAWRLGISQRPAVDPPKVGPPLRGPVLGRKIVGTHI